MKVQPILMIFFCRFIQTQAYSNDFSFAFAYSNDFFVDLFKLKPLWEEHENTIIIILVLVKLFWLFTNVSKIK